MSQNNAAKSTRWCPTPEQVMILEEMYRAGIRTPSSTQIQQITAHLSFYGKIEGKNVFYWFQNHKARDRQKQRRKLCKQLLYDHAHKNITDPHDHSHNRSLFDLYLDKPHSCYGPEELPSCCNSTGFHGHQGGPDQEVASTKQKMNHNNTWMVDNIPEGLELQKSTTRMYGCDWMNVGPPSPPCPARIVPLKTLELFPITVTNLKEECATSNDHLSTSSNS